MTPDPATMLFLLAVEVGCEVRASDGRLGVAVPGAGVQPVPQAVLDAAEDLGWVDLGGDRPALTDRGRYWLAKWAKRHRRAR